MQTDARSVGLGVCLTGRRSSQFGMETEPLGLGQDHIMTVQVLLTYRCRSISGSNLIEKS
jgi:hypothetical protein